MRNFTQNPKTPWQIKYSDTRIWQKTTDNSMQSPQHLTHAVNWHPDDRPPRRSHCITVTQAIDGAMTAKPMHACQLKAWHEPLVLTINRHIDYGMVHRSIKARIRTPWRQTDTRHERGGCCRCIDCQRAGHRGGVSHVVLVGQFGVKTVKDYYCYQRVASLDGTFQVVSRWQWLTLCVTSYFWRVWRWILKTKRSKKACV